MKSKILIMILIGFFLFLSCSKETDEIKIGIISSLTGTIAPYGESVLQGVQLAVDEINKNSGINGKTIKPIIEDDQSDSKIAVSAINKLINVDNVEVVIGPVASSGVMAVASIAEQKKVVVLSPAAASPSITYAGEFIFRNRASGGLEALTMAEIAIDKLNKKTAAIFYINTDYGVSYKSIISDTFTKLGGKIKIIESFDQGKTEFRTELLKISNRNPECIFLLANPQEAGNILKQSKELGLTSQFIANNVEGDEVLNIAGNAAEKLIIVLPFFDIYSDNSATKKFINDFKNRFKKTPDLYAANGFDAVFLIKKAVEKSSYSGEKIKDSLYTITNFQGANGTISFDKNGDVIKPLMIKIVRNGKFVKL